MTIPHGRTLATGNANQTTILWDLTDGAHPRRLAEPLTGHAAAVSSVAFSRDGRTLATGSGDQTLLWDLTDRAHPRPLGQPLVTTSGASLEPPGDTVILHELSSAAFTPDGRTLATGSFDRITILWDLTDRTSPHQLDQPLTGHRDAVWSVAFSPDGHTLATGSGDHTAILWDLTDRAHPRRLGQPLTGHTQGVTSMAFAPDGRTLVTGSQDQTAILWDLTDRAHPRRLGQPLTGHTDVVNSVAMAPDGNTLATGSYDRTVQLWDLANRAHPRRLGQPLTGANPAFAPDGRTLATSSTTVVLWDLTELNDLRRHAVERACSLTRQGFDREEWARYVPGLPYQNTCP